MQWDNNLKLGEHQDFFLRIKEHKLKVASCGSVSAFHAQDHSDEGYKKRRGREIMYLREFLKKHNLKSMYLFSGVKYVWLLD